MRRARPRASADACIVIFLNGGPTHLDMWDLKPDAPAEIRGEFKPIATSVPGVFFGEHLPRFARQMHRCTLIRSAHHSVNNAHAAAVYCALTGHDRGEIGGGARPDDYPAIGSVVGLQRPPAGAVVPHVLLPYITKEGAGGPPQPGFFGGWLGKPRDPLIILRDPNAADFALPELTLGPDIDPTRFDAAEAARRATRRAAATDATLRRRRRHPREGVRPADLAGDARGRADRPRAGEGPRRLRPEHLRPERAAGAAADRGRDAGRVRVVGPGRERHLGHARQQLQQAQERAAAAARRGVLGAARRPRRPRDAGAHAGGGDGRLRPHAEDQRPAARPRPLELLLLARAGRRRGEGRVRPRGERQDRRRSRAATR